MSRPKLTIHNADTGEIIERELNDAELAQHEKDLAVAAARKAEIAAKETAKAALLERLGITADEAALLLG
jgi:hypothetical protein